MYSILFHWLHTLPYQLSNLSSELDGCLNNLVKWVKLAPKKLHSDLSKRTSLFQSGIIQATQNFI